MAQMSPTTIWGIAIALIIGAVAALFFYGRRTSENPVNENPQQSTSLEVKETLNNKATPEAKSPDKPVLPDSILQRVAYFRNAEIPLNVRQEELAKLEAVGDPASIELLIAIASDSQYFNRYAVESLGRTARGETKPGIDVFLTSLLSNSDARVAAASAISLAQRRGAQSIPALADALSKNSNRPDGHSSMVCLSIVRALGQTGSKDATSYLVSELDKPGKGQWNLDYGSEILTALKTINDPSAKLGVDTYITRLRRERPDDPMAGNHYDEKISEAEGVSSLWQQR